MNNFMICNSADQQIQHINEAAGEKYVLEGVFGEISEPGSGHTNRNGRIYTEEEYLKHLSYLRNDIKSGDGLLGELDHPDDRFEVKLKEASHKITDLWYDKAKHAIMGKIELLDTPNGKIAKSLVDEGVPLHISSRAAGTVNPDNTVDIQQIYTYDLVAKPGFASAVLHRVNESEETRQYSEKTREFLQRNEIMETRNLASQFGLNESEVGITPMHVEPKLRKEVRETNESENTGINNTETKIINMEIIKGNNLNEAVYVDTNKDTDFYIAVWDEHYDILKEHAADLQRFIDEHNIKTVNVRAFDENDIYVIPAVPATAEAIIDAIDNREGNEKISADVIGRKIHKDAYDGDNVVLFMQHDIIPEDLDVVKNLAGIPIVDLGISKVYGISRSDSAPIEIPLFGFPVNNKVYAEPDKTLTESGTQEAFKEGTAENKQLAELLDAIREFVKQNPGVTAEDQNAFGRQWIKEHPLSMYEAECQDCNQNTNECGNTVNVSEDDNKVEDTVKTGDNDSADNNDSDSDGDETNKDSDDEGVEIIDVKVISADGDKDEDKEDKKEDKDKNSDSEDDKSEDDQDNKDNGDEEKTDECSTASTEEQEKKFNDSQVLNDTAKSELKKDKNDFLKKIADLTAAIEKKNKSAKECKNEAQVMSQYPVSMMLNESNFAKFMSLNESQKNKVTNYLKNNEITDRNAINEQWTNGLTANEEPVWLKFAPANYRKLYESATENVKNSLKNTAEYVLFENQHDINVFWENSGLERMEETRMLNESFINNMPKIAAAPVNEQLPYSNAFIQQIANMASEYN